MYIATPNHMFSFPHLKHLKYCTVVYGICSILVNVSVRCTYDAYMYMMYVPDLLVIKNKSKQSYITV